MIDTLLNEMKGELVKKLTSQFGLNTNQAEESFNATTDVFTDQVKEAQSKGNMGDLLELFSGKQSLVSSLGTDLTSSLTGKLKSNAGISGVIAGKLSEYIVPFVLNKIGSLLKEQGIDDPDTLAGLLSGDSGNLIKQVTGKLGGLFK